MYRTKTLFFITFALMFSVFLNSQNVLYPQIWFDKNDAVKKLELGKTTIAGEAFTRENSGVVSTKHKPKKGTQVLLFPVTDYILRFHDMKKANPDFAIVMTEEAFSYRIEALTDEHGNFTFTEMKPGKYLIMCNVQFVGTASALKEVGRTHYANGYGYMGSTPIYESYMYNYNGDHFLSKFVEVKDNDKIVEANLKPKFLGGFIQTGSKLAILGSDRCGRVYNKMFGKCTEYYPNGNPRIVAKWSDGAQHGPTIEYYNTGEVYWKGTYKNGQVHGKATYYNKDGSILKTQKHIKGLAVE